MADRLVTGGNLQILAEPQIHAAVVHRRKRGIVDKLTLENGDRHRRLPPTTAAEPRRHDPHRTGLSPDRISRFAGPRHRPAPPMAAGPRAHRRRWAPRPRPASNGTSSPPSNGADRALARAEQARPSATPSWPNCAASRPSPRSPAVSVTGSTSWRRRWGRLVTATAWRAVHPDLRSSRGFRWPWPGNETVAPLPAGRVHPRRPVPPVRGRRPVPGEDVAGAASGASPPSPASSSSSTMATCWARTTTSCGVPLPRRGRVRRPGTHS